jgi:hypothetical protein
VSVPAEEWHEFDTADGERWRVDVGFLRSGWHCIWGAGCRGIGPEADPDHVLGCCTLGAEFSDDDDARNVAAHAACLTPDQFQHAAEAEDGGIFASGDRRATRVVDGACIFLNRAGFAGGAGCALHHGALADGEPPRDWKPVVCWQLPFRIDVEAGAQPVHIVRRWARADFDEPVHDDLGGSTSGSATPASVALPGGDDTPQIPWLCTEDAAAYGAPTAAVERHRDDLVELLGEQAVAEIERRTHAH